jgi:hypothetical protein
MGGKVLHAASKIPLRPWLLVRSLLEQIYSTAHLSEWVGHRPTYPLALLSF